MKAFSRRIIFAILLVLPFLMTASAGATIHGVVYEWNTFQPLENVIVEVNSTPLQSMVCTYGTYSFELSPGNYKITASYYKDSTLTYYAEDFVNITDEGSYVLDLLLFPEYYQGTSSTNASSNISSSSGQYVSSQNVTASKTSFISTDTLVITIFILFVVFIIFRHLASPKTTSHVEKHHNVKQDKIEENVVLTPKTVQFTASSENHEMGSEESVEMDSEESYDDSTEFIITESEQAETTTVDDIPKGPIPSDLQEILDIIRSQGGRMTQKDLRGKLKYSEGKVSLMLFDLEKRGMIQKFKRGRGNVILLVEQDQQS
ncbi:winged helix-turn-helix transcriptional regulator [uncultured Methanomethylovorans sp.]|uniref:helix-turn-helix transcriptional regulator n=1 Tax=uncultured Methanomethylovorans sp. TaxID=183759 RepID=UPI002AA83180|nr:winged helix-turn-helix transcriptional regulator [uncultured Methanomethylovorans sp.]